MSVGVIGTIAAGVVWGWLGCHVGRAAERRWLSWTVLALASAGAAVYFAWRLGPAWPFAAGVAAGAAGYGAWVEQLARRTARPPA